ncbi:uncharacterized protein [Palaemon carinicauda]|uniref:uncharacterized protein n=1 Tax=Palaemon carinicauda TaxID=392227 RepID=UPI0035B699B1
MATGGYYHNRKDSEDQDKDLFYEKLQEVLDDIPKYDMIVLAGDFIAKVGKETDAYAPVIGKESLHEHSNDNGTQLQKTRRSLQDVRSLRGADCDTDHYLVRTKIKTKLSTRKSEQVEKRNRFDVEKLKEVAVKNNFQIKLANRFQMLEILDNDANGENVNTKWQAIEETVKTAAEGEVGYIQRRNAHWYDNECREVVERRKQVRAKLLQAPRDEGGREESQQENRN